MTEKRLRKQAEWLGLGWEPIWEHHVLVDTVNSKAGIHD